LGTIFAVKIVVSNQN